MIAKRQTKAGQTRYEVRLRGADGRERSRTFRTRKEAERYERGQQTELDQGEWIDPRNGRVTLARWTAEWQRTVVHLRPTTRRIYDANLRNHILPELGDVPLAKLTPSMLRGWLAGLTTKEGAHGRSLSLGSVAQVYRTLNRVLAAAVDNESLGRNPLRGVKAPRVAAEPMRFLSHEEVATLAEAIDSATGRSSWSPPTPGSAPGSSLACGATASTCSAELSPSWSRFSTSAAGCSNRFRRAPLAAARWPCRVWWRSSSRTT